MANIRRIHPGIYIKESLEAMEMTAKEFALRTDISERTLSSIINGRGNITFDVAYKLSAYFDNSVNYWMNLQTQYDIFIYEKEKEQEIEEEWKLAKLVKKYLIEYENVSFDDDKEKVIRKLRELVGVNKLQLLCKEDSFVSLKEQNNKCENDCFFQNFWIALAFNEARKKINSSFNKRSLLNSIEEIRSMTLEEPDVFLPRINEILNECGVSFVFLPYLPKSNICGATKWFSKDSVMLALSNRSERADLFWFTLFHEISHVLMEHRRETIISINGNEDIEANRMAEDMLIPREKWNAFISLNKITKETIEGFSKRLGIHPCIVLGRLHRERIVPYNMYNDIFNLKYDIKIR